jgi:hypothetical protein
MYSPPAHAGGGHERSELTVSGIMAERSEESSNLNSNGQAPALRPGRAVAAPSEARNSRETVSGGEVGRNFEPVLLR